ncbi:MAG: Crp/Fnr family transcriptional regulator [Alphaproteobacteria bacterium]|nr:Crp/Fnr family transcriptional regulator [Alphaproteobacteria bacterium]
MAGNNPFITKLANFAPLSGEDRLLIDDASALQRTIPARTDLMPEGKLSSCFHLVISGFACRYKLLEHGRRHIVGYLVPGDCCDLHPVTMRTMDYSLATLTDCQIAEISADCMLSLAQRPAIADALRWSALVSEAILREWLVNIAGRPADQRVAHLLCELLLRLRAVGMDYGESFYLPLTQQQLAETLALSSVHVSRTFTRLRESGLINLRNKQLIIRDFEELAAFGGFNPNYLHLGSERRHSS